MLPTIVFKQIVKSGLAFCHILKGTFQASVCKSFSWRALQMLKVGLCTHIFAAILDKQHAKGIHVRVDKEQRVQWASEIFLRGSALKGEIEMPFVAASA
jgi:hypothetical protein